jgi:hypothetical protein
VVSLPEGVELNCVAQGEMGIYWWGVHLSRIVHKEAELMGEVEQVGSFFFLLPPAVAVVLVSGGEGGVVGVSIGICIGIPSCLGREGWLRDHRRWM